MKNNIKLNRPEISSNEILKTKNFSELKKQYKLSKPTSKPFYKKGWFIGTVSSLAILTTLLLTPPKKESTQNTNNNKQNISNIIIDSNLFIAPPITGIDVPHDKYIINSNTGGEIIHYTGTKINIPSSIFLDANNNIVEGNIEIKYREFHDQVDIFTSGIPMKYDSAGTEYIFESAGMMEISATQNGKKLKIAPNKNISIRMHSNNPSSKFNLYYLDTIEKEWKYKGKDSIQLIQPEQKQLEPSISNAVWDDKLEVLPSNEESRIKILETESLAKKEKVEEIKSDIKNIKKEHPVKPKVVNDKKINFKIHFNRNEFPDIAMYKKLKFEIVNKKDKNIFDIEWENIELQKSNKKNQFNILVSTINKSKTIAVYPVFEKGVDYNNAMVDFEKNFSKYEKKLNQRKEDLKIAERQLLKIKEEYKQIKESILSQQEEKDKQFMNYYGYENKTLKEINRIFSIDKIGFWNSDQPLPPSKNKIQVKGFTHNNKEIEMSNVSIIERDRNRVISIVHWEEVCYDPSINSILIGVGKDNKVYRFNDFKSLEGKQRTIFNMEQIEIDKLENQLNSLKKEVMNNDITSIFPNPNNGDFKFKSIQSINNAKVTIFDMQGKTVYSEIFNIEEQSVKNISINNPINGNYIFKITSTTINEEHKFIVNH